MALPLMAAVYPHVSTSAGVAGGSPVVTGTRVTVRAIAGYYQLGLSPDEIAAALPSLRLAQIHSALAYYFDHQAELDAELARLADVEYLEAEARRHPLANGSVL